MNWFTGYAECYYCKDQNGPWILENQKFICENCYERRKEHEYRNEKRKGNNINTDPRRRRIRT